MAGPCLGGCSFGPELRLSVSPSCFCNVKGHWRAPSGRVNTRLLWLLGRELDMMFVSLGQLAAS